MKNVSSEKSKPIEKWGRKVTGLRYYVYDGWAAWEVNGVTFMVHTGEYVEMDQEWVELLKEAKLIGLTIEEVRTILNGEQKISKS
ncbi:Anti-repressor SinI [Lentibacillus halodurans]|uniref:Anti-repressor SinI n=1 Tax=Lentibacillus halodurans TaxID=237679 RepID=A0A1I0WHT0_9BACI|nr:Anti-repressor SinI [Lentibacillus halodurans]